MKTPVFFYITHLSNKINHFIYPVIEIDRTYKLDGFQ